MNLDTDSEDAIKSISCILKSPIFIHSKANKFKYSNLSGLIKKRKHWAKTPDILESNGELSHIHSDVNNTNIVMCYESLQKFKVAEVAY